MNVHERVREWSLMRRVRALFLVYAIVSFVAPAYQVSVAWWPPIWLKAVVLTGIVALAWWWLYSWRRQRLVGWVEPLEWLVPAGIIYVCDEVSVGAGTVFVVMLYRTLFGRVRDVILRICYIEAALFVPASARAGLDPDFGMVQPAIAAAAAVMSLVIVVLQIALSQHEHLVARERVLAAGARAAATATNRQLLHLVAVRTARDLVGGGPGIRATLTGDGLTTRVLAAAGDDTDGLPGADVHFDRIPAGLIDAFRDGEPIYLDGEHCAAPNVVADVPVGPGGLFLVPLLSGNNRLGTLAVGAEHSLRPEIRSSLITWASQVASSLESLGLHEELTRRAFHDSLTGLPNRALVHERLLSALASCPPDRRVAFMLVDLDGFKQVNDRYGHKAGDELLRAVAVRFMHCVRDSDTVGRLGGDEFAVILPSVPDYRRAVEVAERLVEAAHAPITADGHEVNVGSSVGIALADAASSMDIDNLIRAADIAMYRAKSTHRGGFAMYDAAASA